MKTLKQLYAQTTPDRKQRATYVKLLQTKAGHTKEGLAFVAAQSYSRYKVGADGKLTRNVNPFRYVTVFLFLNKKLHVKVSCSCLDNTFRFEYANFKNKAADIEYSNGAPAVVTNPRNVIGMCKHMACLYDRIKSRLP